MILVVYAAGTVPSESEKTSGGAGVLRTCGNGLRHAYGKDERGTIYATGVHESIKAELKQRSAN
jgi:hypothetical protein